MKHTGLCIATLWGGAMVGAAIAMLITPKTGRQMRDSIREFVEEEFEKMRCKCHDGQATQTPAPNAQ